MSSAEATFSVKPTQRALIQLWLRQIAAIMRLELKKNFFGKRAVLVYLLAMMPVGLLLLIAILPPAAREWLDFTAYPKIFSGLYNALILRAVIFFGCAWIFMNLFRGETVDRSLHYYFLAPVRREVLVVGKYLSGLIATVTLFSITTVGSMLILYFSLYRSESARFFFEGAGAGQLLAYLGVTILACI